MRPAHTLLDLPKREDARGSLVFGQDGEHVPFPVKRFFLLYGMPEGAKRGGHAHRTQHQFLVMAAGAGTIIVDDGKSRSPVRLDSPGQGLHVPPLLWLDLEEFTTGAACLVLASDLYSEADYIRSRDEFVRLTAS